MSEMRFEQIHPKRSQNEEAAEQSNVEFSEKWQRPKEITTSRGEKAKLYDMRPEHEKTPVPVLLVSGFSGNAELWKKNMREFYLSGRRSIILDGSHGVGYDKKDMQLDERARNPEKRKVAAMLEALDGAEVQKADAVAHSKGCIDLVLAALAYPERFRNIVLIEPAGMNPEETLLDVIKRNQLEDAPSMKEAHDAYKKGETDWQIHPDDKLEVNLLGELLNWRSPSELVSIAKVRVVDLLRKIKESGIGILIVQSPEEKMFRGEVLFGTPQKEGEGFAFDEKGKIKMEKVGSVEAQKESPEEDIQKIVDGVISVRGIHVRFYDQPVEYTQLIDGQLTALAAKKGEA